MKKIRDINVEYVERIKLLFDEGHNKSPKGFLTKEINNVIFTVDMKRPILELTERNINYRFMLYEPLWMLNGSNSVVEISQFNSNMANFSDDGEIMFGAYGPKIMSQIDYVVNKLHSDINTRQAVLNIWRENPPDTKDYPCTLNMVFYISDTGMLDLSVSMRSSDIILGIPYDVFSFSMIAYYVCSKLKLKPGILSIFTVSSHIYEHHFELGASIIANRNEIVKINDKFEKLKLYELDVKHELSELVLKSSFRKFGGLN